MTLTETGIVWTDYTWNPVHGCSKVSEGCRHCYAAELSQRQGWTEQPWTINNIDANLQVKQEALEAPASLPGPRWVFVNSMSDLLHPHLDPAVIGDVLGVCAVYDRCAFQVLTKHGPEGGHDVPPLPLNVMLGVTVEHERRLYRLDWLRAQPATTRFVSFEPLLGPIEAPDLTDIDWAIIGGETKQDGTYREMEPAWARKLIADCWAQDVAVLFKQHSGRFPEQERDLTLPSGEVRELNEFPDLPAHVVGAPQAFLEEEVVRRA